MQYTPYSMIDHTFTIHRVSFFLSFFLPFFLACLWPCHAIHNLHSVGTESRKDDRGGHGGGGHQVAVGS